MLHRPGRRNEGKKKVEIPGPPLPLRWSSPSSATSGPGPGSLAAADQRAGGVGRCRDDREVVLLPLADRGHAQAAQEGRLAVGELAAAQRPAAPDQAVIALGACTSIWGLSAARRRVGGVPAVADATSGRQTKRGQEITTSGLLAGLWVLLGALGTLARHGPEKINAMLVDHLPLFAFY